MDLYMTTDSKELLTISDGDSSFISIRITDKEAYILSIMVSEEKRRFGIGTNLLKAAEKTLAERGISLIYANYLGSIDGVREFLLHNEYNIAKDIRIIEIKNTTVHTNPLLEKIRKQKISGLKPVHLKDFDIPKWKKLLQYLSEREVNITCFELASLDQDLSSVIFDKQDKICSAILSSIHENKIYLELLLSRVGKENQYYTIAAMKCVIADILSLMSDTDYDSVLIPACNPSVNAFIENLQKTEENWILADTSFEAYKSTANNSYEDMEPIFTEIDESTQSEWMRALARNPIQHIISWKAPWYKTYQKYEKN